MVTPRKWKVVAGAMSATVALGASAAIAEEGGSNKPPENDGQILSEVVDISQLPAAVDLDNTVLQTEVQDDTESPFDNVTAGDESVSVESESLASEESPESESLPSEESPESESVASEESVSVESVSADE